MQFQMMRLDKGHMMLKQDKIMSDHEIVQNMYN